MSLSNPSREARPVIVVATRHEAGFANDWHAHEAAQLIYPGRGVMKLFVGTQVWVVPPLRGGWLPAGTPHRVVASSGFEMLSVYVRGPLLKRLPDRCGQVTVDPLLRQIILALEAEPPGRGQVLMERLLVERIALSSTPPLRAPLLESTRLRPIEAALAADPADRRSLADWASRLGASTRTLARSFEQETGAGFSSYRRQVRLLAAMERLAMGAPVTTVALDLGFSGPTAFIKAFREATGTTPKRYFSPGS